MPRSSPCRARSRQPEMTRARCAAPRCGGCWGRSGPGRSEHAHRPLPLRRRGRSPGRGTRAPAVRLRVGRRLSRLRGLRGPRGAAVRRWPPGARPVRLPGRVRGREGPPRRPRPGPRFRVSRRPAGRRPHACRPQGLRWGATAQTRVGLTGRTARTAWNAGFSRHSGPPGRGRFVATPSAQPSHPGGSRSVRPPACGGLCRLKPAQFSRWGLQAGRRPALRPTPRSRRALRTGRRRASWPPPIPRRPASAGSASPRRRGPS